MKVEFINPFVLAANAVLEMVLGHAPTKGTIALQPSNFTSQACNVVCGVTGPIEGQVIYGMRMTTAHQVASAMLGERVNVWDQLAASAIAELGNMLSGHALQHLSEAGYVCDITPPTIIRGSDVTISTLAIPAIVIPLGTEYGEISIIVGLQGRK